MGDQTGRLPEALRMAASSRSSQLPIWTAIATRIAYLLALLLVMQTICGFMLYFIIPKFESIFKDFGVPLPRVNHLDDRRVPLPHDISGSSRAWIPPAGAPAADLPSLLVRRMGQL